MTMLICVTEPLMLNTVALIALPAQWPVDQRWSPKLVKKMVLMCIDVFMSLMRSFYHRAISGTLSRGSKCPVTASPRPSVPVVRVHGACVEAHRPHMSSHLFSMHE